MFLVSYFIVVLCFVVDFRALELLAWTLSSVLQVVNRPHDPNPDPDPDPVGLAWVSLLPSAARCRCELVFVVNVPERTSRITQTKPNIK